MTTEDKTSFEKEYKSLEFQFIRRFSKKPSLEAILLLIGYQECPVNKLNRDKEEKVDLINLGTLVVLETLGYFRRIPSDSNWPAFEPTDLKTNEDKEIAVKRGIIKYFKDLGD